MDESLYPGSWSKNQAIPTRCERLHLPSIEVIRDYRSSWSRDTTIHPPFTTIHFGTFDSLPPNYLLEPNSNMCESHPRERGLSDGGNSARNGSDHAMAHRI